MLDDSMYLLFDSHQGQRLVDYTAAVSRLDWPVCDRVLDDDGDLTRGSVSS